MPNNKKPGNSTATWFFKITISRLIGASTAMLLRDLQKINYPYSVVRAAFD
ncbi:hypothetical protein H6G33_27965 [Calothrix sp. FACHB-1219]|uniref:hypothetical protein n=1 Tax=unclassified Calothrix TaxID=2619626 RepID=UPI001682A33C|nr:MULTISPECIES: hypothetical protein [unclassified Calothrix]MBD2206010.1 hypothetical protein [Calothrix sp. FACHB-168]MBD2220815.1 hypothetical protein [Calothrix sp. FACHB-1219]